jgi:rsbT co-antagonist protein RsbR
MIAGFYQWLRQMPEYDTYFGSSERLARVQGLQHSYWSTLFRGEVDERYLASRQHLGEVHARIGLSLSAYFAAMDYSISMMWAHLDAGLPPARLQQAREALMRLVHLDTSLVVEAYSRLTNETIAAQTRSLIELSTPVTALWEDILMLPVVGIIDSKRAQDIMESVLRRIAETRARVFIIDISGVGVVDTAVANHLIKVTKATRLMGCVSLLSGVGPEIAQTIVELGIDVTGVQTTATLRDALEDAFARVGVEVRAAARGPRGRG